MRQCHSENLPHPKGKFAYVLDLKHIAANPKLVRPFQPTNSKLWNLIAAGDMPPDDARAGPLNDSEKQLIRTWIEAGSPAPLTPASLVGASPGSSDVPHPPIGIRMLRLIGKLHVLVVHFPIALLAAAAAAESWWIWRGRLGISSVVRFCVLTGAAGAVAAGLLGWLHASYGGFGADSAGVLFLHRWLGAAAALGAIATAAVCEWNILRARRSLLFRATLFTSAALVGAAGHFGGLMVYGNDFFRW